MSISLKLYAIIYYTSVIFTGPQDKTASPNDLVYYNCHASGSRVDCKWYINGTISSPWSYYQARGFQFIDQQLSRDECNNSLTVIAYRSNNNSYIACNVRVYGQPTVTKGGSLIIAGEYCIMFCECEE